MATDTLANRGCSRFSTSGATFAGEGGATGINGHWPRRESMNATIEQGELVIRIPMGTPTRSNSGKTMIVASTHGAVATGALVDGQAVIVNLNAWIKS